jgi:aryl-alcohol dehydrogenase-like predicted oxidoreductase
MKSVNEQNLKIAAAVGQMAQELGRTSAQVAINWLRAKPGVLPLIGARTLEQFDDNFGCLDFSLSAAQVAQLDELSAISAGYPHEFLARTRRLVNAGFEGSLDL